MSTSSETAAGGLFSHHGIEVVVAQLNVDADTVRASAAVLSDEERRRAERFVFDRDRRRFTVARAGLRRLLAARLNMPAKSVKLVYGTNGKPALGPQSTDSGLRFNLSHSEDVAVYAFAHHREIGIDVELVRRLPDADSLAARFFSRRENEAYLAVDTSARPLAFFNCWTRKEAFIKAVGDGLSHPLDTFDVSLAPGEPARILRVGNTPGERCGWRVDGFSPSPGFVAAVVTEQL
jgi:4'-phosphopantetheinyl transferase